jgi:hypothetical protein
MEQPFQRAKPAQPHLPCYYRSASLEGLSSGRHAMFHGRKIGPEHVADFGDKHNIGGRLSVPGKKNARYFVGAEKHFHGRPGVSGHGGNFQSRIHCQNKVCAQGYRGGDRDIVRPSPVYKRARS